MAKAIAKLRIEKAPAKKAPAKSKATAPATSNIEKVTEEVLTKLKFGASTASRYRVVPG
jgi:hypothetical protein